MRLIRIGRHAVDIETVARIEWKNSGSYVLLFRDGKELQLSGPDVKACEELIKSLPDAIGPHTDSQGAY